MTGESNASEASEKYTNSDKLGVALACLSGVMAIILFLVDKTPSMVAGLLLAMAALLVYPVIHFVRQATFRTLIFVCLVILIVVFGWHVWPKPTQQSALTQGMQSIAENSDNLDIDVIAGWDANSETCRNEVFTAPLMTYAADYFVYVACGLEDKTMDRLFNPKLAISAPFTVNGASQIMNIVYPKGSPLRRGTVRDSVFHAVFVLPKVANISAVRTLHDLKANHGKLVIRVKTSRMWSSPLSNAVVPPI